MRNLLELVQDACYEMGIPAPSAVIGSTDFQVQQLLALSNRGGKELAARQGRDGGWPQLVKEYTFTTVISTAAYDFPSDLQYFVNTTQWDRTQKWPVRGPVSPQEWQVLKSGTVGSAGPRTRFRIKAGQLYLDPTPSAADDLVIEYYSTGWCESSVGTAQTRWAADDDLPVLPDDCLVLDLIWRFKRSKGLDYGQDYNMCEDSIAREIGRAGMAPVLSMDGSVNSARLLDDSNIPDTGMGS